MAEVLVLSKSNSFIVNDKQFQRGKLSLDLRKYPIILIGDLETSLEDLEVDGVTFGSKEELQDWANANLFKSGGGSGGGAVNSVTGSLVGGTATDVIINNPLLEAHQVIIASSARNITDFEGTLYLVTNDLAPATTAILNWNVLATTVKTRKLTLVFTFDCAVTNTKGSGVKFSRALPTSAKSGDVWVVVYDGFYKTWGLESVNKSELPSGTERQLIGYDDSGNPKNITLGWKQLSDLPSPPSFSNGVYTGTAFQPDGTALFGFIELALGTGGTNIVKPNAIPFYNPGQIGTGGGTLGVADAINDTDAVNLKQAKSLGPTVANGSDIKFDADYILGLPTALSTNMTYVTGASSVVGKQVKVYHNSATIPAVLADSKSVRMGTNTYQINKLNVIVFEYVSATRIEYSIIFEGV